MVKPLSISNIFTFLFIFSICTFKLSLAQIQVSPEGYKLNQMQTKKYNYTTFQSEKKSAYIDLWRADNKGFENHPNFGIIAYNAPKGDFVELLEKREVDYRYFINPKNPQEFFIQKAAGALHYQKEGQWLTIDHHLKDIGNGEYIADEQIDPVGISAKNQVTFINTPQGKVKFNQWQLIGIDNHNETVLANAQWNNYTAGEDGIYITEIFPGIDATMSVSRGSVKTNFIVKSLNFSHYNTLIFRDKIEPENNSGVLNFTDISANKQGSGNVNFVVGNTPILEIDQALAYVENNNNSRFMPDYLIHENNLGIVIPTNWLEQSLTQGRVIIDPLVSSSNTLAQASITGSMYNSSCLHLLSCDYTLSVNTPAAAVFTDILVDFEYIAQGLCYLEDGALRFTLGSCVSPPTATGLYWMCLDANPGTCDATNLSLFSDLNSCLPPPSCSPQSVTFGMKFYRSCWGSAGCSNTCIGANSPWVMTIKGQTVSFTNNAPNEFSLSTNTVCEGQNITANLAGSQYGVAPYSVNWSLSASGVPSVGTGNSVSINFPSSGAYTIYCIVTDACGNTVTASKAVTITPPPAPPTVTSPINYCQNQAATPLTATGTSLQWYTTPTGGTPTGAPTPSTGTPGTTSYYVSQIIGGCESTRAQINVIVNAFPAINGGASITQASCGGSDGAISGLSASGASPFTYSWSNSVPVVVGTSNTTADITGQPAGNYTLLVTDANGCTNSYGPVVITSAAPPSNPTATTPINYCQGATAVPLTATGTALLWYTVPTGGTGSATAPTPSTATPGTTSYYVSQTVSGCESSRTQIDVIINSAPAAPTVVSPVNYCQGATATPLTASGTALLWYTVPSGGTGSATAPTPLTATVGSTSYYVSQTVGGCESALAQITVTITAPPTISGSPIVTPSSCNQSDGSISGLTATGTGTLTYTWMSGGSTTVSTSTSNANLNNQPAGTYTLVVTDAAGCSVSSTPVQITNNTGPGAPVVSSPVNYCQGATATQLSATGTNLLWYTVPVGGTPSATAPTPSTSTPGTVSYYVSQTVSGCESPYAQIDIIVTATPAAPTVTSPVNYCQNSTATALTATGNSLLWYTVAPPGGIGSSTAPTPSTSTPGTTTYYVTDNMGSCEGPAAQITVQVNGSPVINGTAVISPSNCGQSDGSITGFTATGSGTLTYTWTDALSNVVSTSTANADLNNQPAGTYTLTVSDASGCSSSTTPQQITNSSGPQAPVVNSPVTYCQGATAIPLTAVGNNLTWYLVPGGTGSPTAPTPSTSTIGTVSYYVTQTVNGCESSTAQIDVIVSNPPTGPSVVSPVNLCLGGSSSPLTATGNNLLWYTVPVGGTGSPTAPTPSTSALGTTSYYVSQNNNGCESVRTQIDVIVGPGPSAPNVVSPVSYCQGATATPLTATGSGLLWYTTPTGGTGTPTLTPSTATPGNTSYYVSQTVGGCESSRSEIVVVVNPSVVPEAVITSTSVNVCQGSLISFSAVVNNAGTNPTLQWLVNGNPVPGETSLNYSTSTLTGNASVAIQVISNAACANPTQITSNIITVNVMPNASPIVTLATDPPSVCFGQAITVISTPLYGGTNPQFVFMVNGQSVQAGSSNQYTSPTLMDSDVVSVIMSSNYPCLTGSNTTTSSPLTIHISAPPSINATANPDTIINGQSTLLTGITNGANAQYLWEPATFLVCDICPSTEATPNTSTTYFLTITDISTGCVNYDTVDVYVTYDFSIFVPTAFSPNQDGINDYLYVRGTGIKSFTFTVFDRWGGQVFKTTDMKEGWDGTFEDKPVVSGVYTYYLNYEKYDGGFGELKGNITLTR